MTFFRVEMLFLIWSVPLLFLVIYYGMRKRRKILNGFSTPKALKIISPENTGRRRWGKSTLVLLSVFFISVALSGPKYGFKWQEIEQKGIDIIIALDCSRSMTAADIKPTRLDRAKREVFDLLGMLKGDRVGLVAFAGTAFLQCPLTLDYETFNLFLNTLSPDYLPVGGTDITGAVGAALQGFDAKSGSEKAIILITDGENTGNKDPVESAEGLKKKGIKLFCIGVGSAEGVPIPEPSGGFKKDRSGKILLSRLDENTLKQMAVNTGGTYVRSVAGDMDLDAIYTTQIRGKMETATLTSSRKQIWEDRFQWPLIAAVIFLLSDLFLPVVRKKVILSAAICILIFMPNGSYAAEEEKRADEYYETGEYDKALKRFIDAQLKNPDKPEILYNIGNAYYKKGEYNSAADHYKQALETEDLNLKKNALYNLGNAEFKKGDPKAAIKHYETLLEMDPEDAQAKENLAFVKKIMEQQQKSGNTKDQQKDSKKKQNKDQKNQEGSSSQQQQEEKDRIQNDKKEAGKENNMDESKKEKQPTPGEDKDASDAETVGESIEPENVDHGVMEKQQAQRMLDRLKDQPGGAMIPMYQKKQVERDW